MFVIVLSLVMMFCTEAKNITTERIENIEVELAKANNETLVIFDYDDVLLEPVDVALLAVNEHISEKIKSDITKGMEKDQIIVALSILTRDMKMELVHERWPLLIAVLQSRGIKTMLLTACGAGTQGVVKEVVNVRRNHLLNFGIDFQKSWPNLPRMDFSDISRKHYIYCNSHYCAFVDGMIFADGADKGEVLKAFLFKVPQYKFKKVVFIDNKSKNLKSVERACKTIGVEFVGIEYTYSKIKKHPTLDLEKAKKQYTILMREKRWIPDNEMDCIMEHDYSNPTNDRTP